MKGVISYQRATSLFRVVNGRLVWKVVPSRKGHKGDFAANNRGLVYIGIQPYKESDILYVLSHPPRGI